MALAIPSSMTFTESKPYEILDSFQDWLQAEQDQMPHRMETRRTYRQTDEATLHESRFWLTEEGLQSALAEVQTRTACHPNKAPAALLESLKTTLGELLLLNGLAFTQFAWVTETLGTLCLIHAGDVTLLAQMDVREAANTRCHRLTFVIAPKPATKV